GLHENPGFLRVWAVIVLVQAAVVNAALVPLEAFAWVGNMFSCTPFRLAGWGLVFLLAATMIPADLIRKSMVRKG
ncbi:MAG: hypothetical protein IKN33_07715, partial [Selenomonadaceae bacterium]|nr:hypothetical protein [Selenomonadaceae bacterium]